MEYQLIKIAKTHHRGRGEVVSALPTIASTIKVQETTAQLVNVLNETIEFLNIKVHKNQQLVHETKSTKFAL